MDDLVSVTPPGKGQHVMDFGKDGNEVRYTAPGVAPITFGYDLDRVLASVTNEDGSSSTLSYDTAGRVTSVTYPGGPLGVAYDPKTGQLRTLTTPGSSLAIDYDGLLVRGVTATGPAPGTVTFTYDGMLRRGSEQVGTSTVKYGYDHDGLLTQAGSIAVGRESASGLISGIDVVNVAQRFTHTPFGELATYRSQGAGGNVLDVALTYDALARIVDKVENGAAWHYDYDVRGRLTRVRKDGADVATYAYDANGNRADGAAVIDAQDRVLSMNGATYTYSAAGERLTRTTGAGVTTYLYDGRGHLSSVTAPSGVRADYDLDAYGRRVTKRRNGTVQNRFLYRNGLQPIADVDAAGALVSRYIYARGELGPDALERAGATYLLLKDERGSIRFVIDATSGAVLQALGTTPSGACSPTPTRDSSRSVLRAASTTLTRGSFTSARATTTRRRGASRARTRAVSAAARTSTRTLAAIRSTSWIPTARVSSGRWSAAWKAQSSTTRTRPERRRSIRTGRATTATRSAPRQRSAPSWARCPARRRRAASSASLRVRRWRRRTARRRSKRSRSAIGCCRARKRARPPTSR